MSQRVRFVLPTLVALHAVALLAVIVELVWPVGEEIKRAQALDFTGSYAVCGALAGVLLVICGLVLRRLVMRRDNYYGEHD